MKKVLLLTTAACALAGLTGCDATLGVLKATNSALGAVNSALGGSSSSSSGVYVSEAASASATAAANKARPTGSATALFNSARPTIEKMVGMAACNATSKQMQRFADPDAMGYLSPFSSMHYHKSGCLNVLRINAIEKRSANAIHFKVTYMSPQSEESTQREYTAIKQPDGEWLFKWSYY